MQYRNPVGSGPSLKTCPRCDSQLLQSISVRIMLWVWSVSSRTFELSTGWVNRGHPLRLSFLVLDSTRGCRHPFQPYSLFFYNQLNSFGKAGRVPLFLI